MSRQWAILAVLWGLSLPALLVASDPALGPHEAATGHDHSGEEPGHHGHQETVHGKPVEVRPTLLGIGTEMLAIPKQLFVWTILVFLISYFLLRTVTWTPLLAQMKARERRMEDNARQAKELQQRTEQLLASQDAQLAEAQQQARQIVEAARQEAVVKADEVVQVSRQQADSARKQAEAEIQQASDQAMEQLRAAAVDLSSKIGSKLLDRNIPLDQAQQLADREQLQ